MLYSPRKLVERAKIGGLGASKNPWIPTGTMGAKTFQMKYTWEEGRGSRLKWRHVRLINYITITYMFIHSFGKVGSGFIITVFNVLVQKFYDSKLLLKYFKEDYDNLFFL